jgi:hypothetical protein
MKAVFFILSDSYITVDACVVRVSSSIDAWRLVSSSSILSVAVELDARADWILVLRHAERNRIVLLRKLSPVSRYVIAVITQFNYNIYVNIK